MYWNLSTPRHSRRVPLFFSRRRPPPRSTLFPYTTLFRSYLLIALAQRGVSSRDNAEERIVAGGGHEKEHGKGQPKRRAGGDRKSTRLNSSHRTISYAVFCLKKKNNYDILTHLFTSISMHA